MKTAVEWAPKNGERVWVKVFSNWSLGTYIGFDAVKNMHLVREDASGGGSLMSSSLVLPKSANPNVPKELTAVEWLVYHLQKSKDWQRVLNEVSQMSTIEFDLIQQAKEMEKKQIINSFSEGTKMIDVNDELSAIFNAVIYYDETFKTE